MEILPRGREEISPLSKRHGSTKELQSLCCTAEMCAWGAHSMCPLVPPLSRAGTQDTGNSCLDNRTVSSAEKKKKGKKLAGKSWVAAAAWSREQPFPKSITSCSAWAELRCRLLPPSSSVATCLAFPVCERPKAS